MSKTLNVVETYMNKATNPDLILDKYRESVPNGTGVDTLVGIGLSGSLVVPNLARSLGLEWLVLRKQDDGSHSSMPAFGHLGHRWMFVDDFISSGRTLVNAIHGVQATVDDSIGGYGDWDTELIGAFCYQSDIPDNSYYSMKKIESMTERGCFWSLREYFESLKPKPVVLDDLTIHDARENLKESGFVYAVPNADERVTIKTLGGGGGGADSAINGGTGLTFDPARMSWPVPITIPAKSW